MPPILIMTYDPDSAWSTSNAVRYVGEHIHLTPYSTKPASVSMELMWDPMDVVNDSGDIAIDTMDIDIDMIDFEGEPMDLIPDNGPMQSIRYYMDIGDDSNDVGLAPMVLNMVDFAEKRMEGVIFSHHASP